MVLWDNQSFSWYNNGLVVMFLRRRLTKVFRGYMAWLVGLTSKYSSKANQKMDIDETKLVKGWTMSKLDDGSWFYYFLYFLLMVENFHNKMLKNQNLLRGQKAACSLKPAQMLCQNSSLPFGGHVTHSSGVIIIRCMFMSSTRPGSSKA